jgi:hypothetical protein
MYDIIRRVQEILGCHIFITVKYSYCNREIEMFHRECDSVHYSKIKGKYEHNS